MHNVEGPRKVYVVLLCDVSRMSLLTGQDIRDVLHGRSHTHTITVTIGDVYDEMWDKIEESHIFEDGEWVENGWD